MEEPSRSSERMRSLAAGKRPIEGATTGTFVSAATEALRDSSDIHLSLAAQTHTEAAIGQFAEEQRHFHTLHG